MSNIQLSQANQVYLSNSYQNNNITTPTTSTTKEIKDGENKINKVLAGLAILGAAAIGVTCIIRGKKQKNTPTTEDIQKLVKQFQDIDFNKGQAKLKDGTLFTGVIEDTLKTGDKVVIEYSDGVIQKSSKISNGEEVVKEYTNGVISKKNGEVVDIKKVQNEAKEQQAKLKKLFEDDKISAEEFKKQSDEIKYKSKKQEAEIQETFDRKTKAEKEITKPETLEELEQFYEKISEDEIMKILKEHNLFSNTLFGEYKFKIPENQKISISNKYKNTTSEATKEILSGSLDELIIKNIQKPLSQEDIEIMLKLANICDGKHAKYFREHPMDLITSYQILRGSDLDVNIVKIMLNRFSNAEWDVVINTIKNKANGDILDSLCCYKDQSGKINKALSALKLNKNAEVTNETKKIIDDLTAYIDTQKSNAPLNVFRYDNYAILDDVIIDGSKLSDIMEEVEKSGNQEKIKNCIELIKKSNCTKTQERFISTSIAEPPGIFKNKSDIVWELEVPSGTKGAYIETMNISPNKMEEGQFEYLIQRNSNIEIKDAAFVDGKWHLKGKIIQ